MRLWSVHPRYLDRQALVACWREALLAQAVLAGATKGYRNHPQLIRFRAAADPLAAVGGFLRGIADEADARVYRFDRSRILHDGDRLDGIAVTRGQLDVEWRHLMVKLTQRSPELAERWHDVTAPDPHPLFTVVPGDVAEWERAR
ncbi:pyrimidine dimer DNA glycosylase/endonuclease V [Microbacterium sp. Mu-80]|uniref:Pyrimidine dimer DNA glycosylase/endonuclease V n=1 Tax=Microbacterium bandirmense TaxID=3122050 RepID=A0ABU8L8J4_9MICO